MISIFIHFFVLTLAISVIWYVSGIVIKSTEDIASHYNKSGFLVAFFVLGFLSSISEMSVAINSTIEKVPQVAIGNLIGASVVIMMCIVPIVAIANNGIKLKGKISPRNLALTLLVITLPAILSMDGAITPHESIVLIFGYVAVFFFLARSNPQALTDVTKETQKLTSKAILFKSGYLAGGAILIFFSGMILVKEVVAISTLIGIPSSIAGLIILSLGTNMPEIAIAIQSIRQKKDSIAFGDYLGSAAANTPILALVVAFNGSIFIPRAEFIETTFFLIFGLVAFYIFARSRQELSRTEGIIILLGYITLGIIQILNVGYTISR